MTFQHLLAGGPAPARSLLLRDLLLVVVFAQASWAAWRLGRRAEAVPA